ncbi:uncharacterized protein LOC110901688 [Helianthus annuus]|uniref:uncharacterized protein LOC110901688 n=1 Tax=Helianthus annuus TaxID=4232 RepID=UPI000B8F63A2|nr:uncharacterized protein LOC110901688 [Helianthus annuus]
MEKLTLSLIFASRKLRRYFQAHKVVLLTDQPLQKVLRRPELSGRLAKWEVELGYHAIEYKTRTSVFYTNGASSEKGNGAVITLISPEGIELTYAIRLDFENTNNTTEYESLLDGLRQAKKVKARNIEANSNSQLVVKQYNGEYDAKDDTMAQYMTQVKELAKTFNTFKMEYVPQGKNRKENALSKLASVTIWLGSEGTLPEDEALSKKIWEKALQYEIIDGPLFRRSYLGPCLKCVDEEEAKYVIQEIHEGIHGMYSGPKTVVAKAMNAGFYWNHVYDSALEEIRKCDNYQVDAPMTTDINTIWFQSRHRGCSRNWAIDIIRPFPEGLGGVKFVVDAIDYFTKWVEGRPLAKITGEQMKKVCL